MVACRKMPIIPAPVTFNVQVGSRRVQYSYQQVFAAGYKLWLAGRYFEAAEVFKHLTGVSDRGPRAHIVLAHCKAMAGDYGGCSSTLAEAMPAERFGNAASQLHDVFVLWKCTLFVDVKQGLLQIVAEHPELPTACLLLADLLMNSGNGTHPRRLFRQAMERDRPDGAVAMIARSHLAVAVKRAAEKSSQKPVAKKRIA